MCMHMTVLYTVHRLARDPDYRYFAHVQVQCLWLILVILCMTHTHSTVQCHVYMCTDMGNACSGRTRKPRPGKPWVPPWRMRYYCAALARSRLVVLSVYGYYAMSGTHCHQITRTEDSTVYYAYTVQQVRDSDE